MFIGAKIDDSTSNAKAKRPPFEMPWPVLDFKATFVRNSLDMLSKA